MTRRYRAFPSQDAPRAPQTAAVPLKVVSSTETPPTYTAKRLHPSYVVERCPRCDFPEADGGYCPDCGWMEDTYTDSPGVKGLRYGDIA